MIPNLAFTAGAAAPVEGRDGMVVSSVGPAAEAGHEILKQGGNAIDAAVATAFAAGVAHPFSSGIGGGGFILVRLANGETLAIDARELAPAAVTSTTFQDPNGRHDPRASRAGGRAVAVPGLVQGLESLHRRYGQLDWEDVLAPAIRMCEEGVEVGPFHQRLVGFVAKYLPPETAAIQLKDGKPPPLGWRLVQKDLARTYRTIALHGSRAMTQGPIAHAIVETVRESGGVMTLADLRGYELKERKALVGTYRDRYQVISMPPPSSGGVHLIEILNVLEAFDLKQMGVGSVDSIHLIAEAMKLAFADRAVFLGDPDFTAVPVERLTSKSYAAKLARRLKPVPFYRKPPWRWGRRRILHVDPPVPQVANDSGTTHLSAMDAEGNSVAITQTINTPFGSGLTAKGTGIVLNNEMDDFATAPDAPNAFNLVGYGANRVEPRKRPLSSMTPTIVLRDGKPWLVVGSPMGPKIITAVLQAIINMIDHGMNAQDAVAAPRFHHQWKPDALELEAAFPQTIRDALIKMGHPVKESRFGIGAAQVIEVDLERGVIYGGADPRRASRAVGYSIQD